MGLRAQAHLEPLEQRRLFFAAIDYFPLLPAHNWTYNATVDGDSATTTRTMAATTSGTTPVVRVRDRAVESSRTVFLDNLYTNDRNGLKQYRTDLIGPWSIQGTLTPTPALPILPRFFGTGVVSQWNDFGSEAEITVPEAGISGLDASGSDSGSTTVTSTGRLERLGFSFLNTIKAVITHDATYTASIQGFPVTVTTHTVETQTLAKGIGLLEGSFEISATVVAPGVNESASAREDYTLTASSLLTSFSKSQGGAIRVGGSVGNDTIGVGFEGNNILVVRNDIGKSYSSNGITRIVVDASDGNDVVGPLKVGRLRSSLIGGKGNDAVTGGNGRDYIYGGEGNDTLIGGPGADTIFGDAGDDIINGLNGNDSLDGGLGKDTTKRDDNDVARIAFEVLV